MVSVRKVTGRERGRFRPHDVHPRLVSRMGIYTTSSSSSEFNIAAHPMDAAEIVRAGNKDFASNNILIHWVKAINIGSTTSTAQTKQLHFWSGNTTNTRDVNAGNHIFSLTVPPADDKSDGGIDVTIEFPIPLLIEAGGMIAVKSTGANYDMKISICYTVLNSLSVGSSKMRYKFLSAASTQLKIDKTSAGTILSSAVKKTEATTPTYASTGVIIPFGAGGQSALAQELDSEETTKFYVDSVSGFSSAGVVIIDSEEIRYTAVVVGTGGGDDYISIGERGYNNTNVVTHGDTRTVDELKAIDTNQSTNNLNIDGISISFGNSGGVEKTCKEFADIIVAGLSAATTYTVTIDSTNNRRVVFTDKAAGSGRNLSLVASDLTYYRKDALTNTLSIPSLTGGADSDVYTEDIEIWGVAVMNLVSTFGSSRVATTEVLNAYDDVVAEVAIHKDDRNSFSLPIPVFYDCDESLDGHETEALCDANASEHGDSSTGHWTATLNPTKWNTATTAMGARNRGSDTYVSFYRFPIYCKGSATGTNFKIGVDTTNQTRATWFYRPVKARGLEHGWV